ncbi:MAG: L,D-transpeptidase family protein [Proteobacteria bacterium]|nr:L,D-transpeptidase family protein [Pseudomonadota bacterium]
MTRNASWSAIRRLGALGLALVIASGAPAGLQAQGLDAIQAQIAAQIPTADRMIGKPALRHGALQALGALYANNADSPLWSHEGSVTPQALALLLEIQNAESYGLRPKDYAASDLGHLADQARQGGPGHEQRLAHFDLYLTVAALEFVSDLHFGRVSPEAAGFQLPEAREPFDLKQALLGIAGAPDMPGAMAAVEPVFYHYKLLKEALGRYRHLAQEGPYLPLPAPPRTLKPGDAYAGSGTLRHRLEVMGDVPAGTAGAEGVFDAQLSAGVKNYQLRHGLTPDGSLGKATLAALAVPLAQRIRQITLTLERWRWLPPFKTPPIIVNIPQFRLFAFRSTEDRAADILQMNVIVGRTFTRTQTPVFEGDMRYVVLRPYWDVPTSITRNELLPKIRAHASYLDKERLEIVNGQGDNSPVVAPTPENLGLLAAGRLRLRQQPGEDNALGLAKFVFPNSYNVYLHSTPAHQLFREPVRAFSHGCIRVADPVALAELVLKNAPGDWTREKIQSVMNGNQTSVRINLTRPIQVLILYATALATEAGPVLFFNDIYGYDRRLEQQLGLPPVH